MAAENRKYEVSDPAYYDPLIAGQKKRVRQNPHDPGEWVELGRLHEAKIDMIKCFAMRNFGIRYFIHIYFLFLSLGVVFLTYYIIPDLYLIPLLPLPVIVTVSAGMIVLIILSRLLWSVRYPPSGSKYFRRAIAADSDFGEAYMHLGAIALRRRQKRKACRLLEQAVRLNVADKKIKRELKSVYEKEFMVFFNERTAREARQQEIIDRQLEQIRKLRSRVSSLERLTESLSGRAEQARWESKHKAKLLDQETTNRIEAIRQDYEERIAGFKQARESREEARELAQRDFVRLTTEIMEAKAGLEVRSLAEAAGTMEDIMGSRLWQALSEQARTYLATAEQIYPVLTEREEKPDCSLVGMELCKALETEINRKLVEPFGRYLNKNKEEFLRVNQTGGNNGRPSYFTYLAKVVDDENFPEMTSLTLGQYHFALERILEGEYALKEYGDFLDEVCSSSGVVIGRMFLERLGTVTKKYRNAIAHRSSMNKKEYDHLRELIFAGKDALLVTCCSISPYSQPSVQRAF